MHFHYYTLLQLKQYIQRQFLGRKLFSCFSQNKNELIIELENGYFRVGCHTPLTYIVPEPAFFKAKRNVVDLFPELWGKKLENVKVMDFERIMIWSFEEEFELIFKLHASRSNILLREKGCITKLFNQQIQDDLNYKPEKGIHSPNIPQDAQPADVEEVYQLLRAISPIYGKVFAKYLWKRMGEGCAFEEAFGLMKKELEEPAFYIVKQQGKMQFRLLKIGDEQAYIRKDAIEEALTFFLKTHYQLTHYTAQHGRLGKVYSKPLKKFEKVYSSYTKNIHHLETERNPEELGHILMANLHAIKTGDKEVVLDDFYTQDTIKIKLNPRLSPQENAARYYEKHKQRKGKLAYLKNQLQEIEEKLFKAQDAMDNFSRLTLPEALPLHESGFDLPDIKRLKGFIKETTKAVEKTSKNQVPFRSYRKEGFDIFVGRNAKNNDELSFKFASKEDLWLHAKDVTGSHVVIRHQAGKVIPITVLEYAAGLAAYYSKRKTDSLVPVQYTQRKYIRKRKGDPAGMVKVDREDVLMIEPTKG